MNALTRVHPAPAEIVAFVNVLAELDGVPPLSEHKMLQLGGGSDARVGAWVAAGSLAVVGVAAGHAGDDPHWAIEVATGASLRTPGGEAAAIEVALDLPPSGPRRTLWAHRGAQLEAAASLGLEERRRVLRMEGPLPGPPEVPAGIEVRAMTGDDEAALIAVHNRAFAGHPEASGMDEERIAALKALPWYDPEGVIVARDGGGLLGYCWTKLHANGDGEVYFIAVDPDHVGRGLGEALVRAGFASLGARGATGAMLWVDGDNAAAIRLYEGLGLEPVQVNVELDVPG